MTKPAFRFLQGTLIWEGLVLLPLVIVYMNAKSALRREDLNVLGLTALLGVVVVIVCSLTAPRVRGFGAPLMGIGLGTLFPVICGLVFARILGGFELSAAIFSGAMVLALPSGVAGGVIGWLNRRRA
jgi:hypothetical protein